jgi:oligoribonuclease
VSTLKELAKRWAPSVLEGVRKSSTHSALEDVKESIEELRHYRKLMFRVD